MGKKMRSKRTVNVFLVISENVQPKQILVRYQTRGSVLSRFPITEKWAQKNETQPSFLNQLRDVWIPDETLFESAHEVKFHYHFFQGFMLSYRAVFI